MLPVPVTEPANSDNEATVSVRVPRASVPPLTVTAVPLGSTSLAPRASVPAVMPVAPG